MTDSPPDVAPSLEIELPAHWRDDARQRSLPRALAAPALPRGRIKVVPEDFQVEEIPAYLPSGEGEFLYLWIEKVDASWSWLEPAISRALRLDRGEVGAAGVKDRRAVTRQWISVPKKSEPLLGALNEIPGLTVLEVSRHNNKLKTGHLRGNRFRVRIRCAHANEHAAAVATAVATLAQGLPNVYGDQRFGSADRTLSLGWQLLGGRAPKWLWRDRFKLRMAVSAVQSALFNDWVTARLDEGLGRVALLGDVLKKTDTGGLFNVTEDDDLEVERNRLASLQTVVTGPMFGTRMREATHVSGQREADVLARAGLALSRFEAVSKVAQGTRRPLYVFPEGLDARVMDDGFEIAFSLPAGAYATVLLRELVAELESGEDAATAAESPADSESTDE